MGQNLFSREQYLFFSALARLTYTPVLKQVSEHLDAYSSSSAGAHPMIGQQ